MHALALEPLFSLPRPWLIGVVHLAPLPGSPGWFESAGDVGAAEAFAAVEEAARADARALRDGCDGLIVENFGDAPFFAGAVPPETVAAMARLLAAVRGELHAGQPLGANVLRNDARSALALCSGGGADFLRVNVHSGAYVTDQGLIEGRAAETVRERARLCPAARLLCDVHVKHAAPLAASDLVQAAADTHLRGRADALILTGGATGASVNVEELCRVREALPDCPLLVGSGMTARNAPELLDACDGAIVGTTFKRDGHVLAPVEKNRVDELSKLFRDRRS